MTGVSNAKMWQQADKKDLYVVTLKIDIDGTKDETKIYGIGESTGFLPMKIPFAPFFNIFLCWVPFLDMGNNKRYLRRITKNLGGN